VEGIKSLFPTLQFRTLNEPTAATIEPFSEYPRLQKVLSHFEGLIKITREKDNTIPQALASLEKAQLLRILVLTTEQIQWAILQGQGQIYQESLSDLKKLCDTYFVDNEGRQALQTRLDKLSQQSPVITIPDISGSLEALTKAQAQLKTKETERLSQGRANDTIN
jgi:uroporphyrin-III C-methyltransferase